ncbi:MAG: 1-acyl-sn-glycerol-3-phosphate acyltransferase [Candidatus Woesebacteria bacterium]|nr:1-acyl-sn-glycerol-3-phosphate acyltransferase [Candidatus Woesebacteria bacterium]
MNVVFNRQPKNSDPQEIAIKTKLEKEILKTPLAIRIIKNTKELQAKFFKKAFSEDENSTHINQLYQKLLKDLATETNVEISSGLENLQEIITTKNVIIITNHLGIIKLTKINNIEPFPLRHASILPISQRLNMSLHESAIELPGKLSSIQRSCGVIVVNAGGRNRTQQLIDDTRKIIDKEQSAIVMYPEGGTSGKRNNAGPYDLDVFHTGAFVVAKNLNINILPICQYFSPDTGFKLHILKPLQPQDINTQDLRSLANNLRLKMQTKLYFQNSLGEFK